MQFQSRDGKILERIYENDGVMARRHLKNLFWPDKSWRAMERRIKKLKDAGYISKPSRDLYKIHPIPEPICWLGLQGAIYLAGQKGVDVGLPESENETQVRDFQKELRKHGIRWTREPRWSLLRHDLAAIDFRLAIENAVGMLPGYTLTKWIPEGEFRSNMDVVEFKTKDRKGIYRKTKKGVCPDGYFEIVDIERRMGTEPIRYKFLLEVDMSTHDNPSFGREKALPGVAYIKSPTYKRRFGSNDGCWLVVTISGDTRLKNLIRQTRIIAGDYAKLFYFTTLKLLGTSNPLISPIWIQNDQEAPRSLIDR